MKMKTARERERMRVREEGDEGGSAQPELNPFGRILRLAFCLTALKSHASQPHKLTSL